MKRRKVEPSALTMFLDLGTVASGAQETRYIDISQCASLVNRRFYRQGLQWPVAGFKIAFSMPAGVNPSGRISISKLPQTWTMSNAWHKAFATWQSMNAEALEESESIKPRFLDFKIYADETHHAAGFGANVLPTSLLATATAGEWEPSKVYIPTGTAGTQGQSQQRELLAVGSNYPGLGATGLDAVSIIEGYAASRGLPNVLDPNAPDDAASVDGFNPQNWLSAIFNEGTEQKEEILEDMIGENNLAPYPFENDGVNLDTMYPGGSNQLTGLQLHDLDLVSGTTIGGMTRMKGGTFPCGLVRLDLINLSDEPADVSLLMDLVPGPHRGYLCQPMQEM